VSSAYSAVKVNLKVEYGTYPNFSGKISKTILLMSYPELQPFFQPLKGIIKPIHVSPLMNGEALYAYYDRGVLKSPEISGNYSVIVGGPSEFIEEMKGSLKKDVEENVRSKLKIDDKLLIAQVLSVENYSPRFDKRVKVCFSPTLLSNPYLVNRDFRRFLPSPSATFWIPYAMLKGKDRLSPRDLIELERGITETWKTFLRTRWIVYDGKKEPVLTGKVEYQILDDEMMDVFRTAFMLGVGASRSAGFGHVYPCGETVEREHSKDGSK
jgi:hypothetical protein